MPGEGQGNNQLRTSTCWGWPSLFLQPSLGEHECFPKSVANSELNNKLRWFADLQVLTSTDAKLWATRNPMWYRIWFMEPPAPHLDKPRCPMLQPCDHHLNAVRFDNEVVDISSHVKV
jgi:hypothetical protein